MRFLGALLAAASATGPGSWPCAAAAGDTPRSGAGPHPGAGPAPRLPRGAWDSHVHVTDPVRFPPRPGAAYRPGAHSIWDSVVFEHGLGCEHVVLVQPSIYGSDNTLLTDALRALGPARARGVVVVDTDAGNASASAAQLRAWHALGVRGLRVNLQSRAGAAAVDEPALERALRRAAAAAAPLGWVLQLYVPLGAVARLERCLATLGVRVVLDHFGDPALPPPVVPGRAGDPVGDPYALDGFAALVRLLRQGRTWVKLSAPYRLSRLPGPLYADLDALTRELLRVAPARLVYASDWPHTRFEGLDIGPWTAHLLALMRGDDALRRRVFRDNARELWTAERPSAAR